MLDKISISKKINTSLVKFMVANALYSLSTWLISFLSPYILQKSIYEEFIYTFQTMLYVASLFTLGLAPTLLRYFKYDKDKYLSYFLYCVTFIFLILTTLGLWIGNPFSKFLHIDDLSFIDHLLFYSSSIGTLLYVFNRAILTASEQYSLLFKTIILISVLRLLSLLCISLFEIKSLYIVLILVCIVPMSWEFLFYLKRVVNIKKLYNSKDFIEFLLFAITTSIIGIIYVTNGRLYLLELKKMDSSNVPILSYIYGMLGVITIFNTTFTSYFIGKLDGRNITQIQGYVQKLKVFSLPYILFSFFLSLGMFVFVYICYPYDNMNAGVYAAIASLFSSLTAYIGLLSLMTKTLKLLNMQLIVNILSLLITVCLLKFVSNIDSIPFYIIISTIHFVFEFIVVLYVLWTIQKMNFSVQNKKID